MQVLMGTQPNVTHYSPRPKVGKQVFHPCPIIPMHIIICFLPHPENVSPYTGLRVPVCKGTYTQEGGGLMLQGHTMALVPCGNPTPPPCISYANVHNYYGPYAYCSLDKGVACAQHIQLPTYTCAG